MQLSARNVLKGRVKQVAPGVVNTEVTIELPGGTEIVSMITKSSAERLHLAQGSEVWGFLPKAPKRYISRDVYLLTS